MLKGAGMTPTAYRALAVLTAEGPRWLTTREIVDLMGRGRQVWLWRAMKALRTRGFVEQAIDVLRAGRDWADWEPEHQRLIDAIGSRSNVYEWLFAHRITDKGRAHAAQHEEKIHA